MKRKGIAIGLFITAGVFALSWIVMKLWNYALVPAIDVNELSYWQAMGLLVLSKILFGGFKFGPRAHRGSDGWKSHWNNMNEDRRSKYKEEWKKRCAPKPSDNQDII